MWISLSLERTWVLRQKKRLEQPELSILLSGDWLIRKKIDMMFLTEAVHLIKCVHYDSNRKEADGSVARSLCQAAPLLNSPWRLFLSRRFKQSHRL